MNTISINEGLVTRIREFIEMKFHSGLMELALITPKFFCRMWGDIVEACEIEAAFDKLSE